MACAGLAKIGDGRVDVGLPLSESCFLGINFEVQRFLGAEQFIRLLWGEEVETFPGPVVESVGDAVTLGSGSPLTSTLKCNSSEAAEAE